MLSPSVFITSTLLVHNLSNTQALYVEWTPEPQDVRIRRRILLRLRLRLRPGWGRLGGEVYYSGDSFSRCDSSRRHGWTKKSERRALARIRIAYKCRRRIHSSSCQLVRTLKFTREIVLKSMQVFWRCLYW